MHRKTPIRSICSVCRHRINTDPCPEAEKSYGENGFVDKCSSFVPMGKCRDSIKEDSKNISICHKKSKKALAMLKKLQDDWGGGKDISDIINCTKEIRDQSSGMTTSDLIIDDVQKSRAFIKAIKNMQDSKKESEKELRITKSLYEFESITHANLKKTSNQAFQFFSQKLNLGQDLLVNQFWQWTIEENKKWTKETTTESRSEKLNQEKHSRPLLQQLNILGCQAETQSTKQ